MEIFDQSNPTHIRILKEELARAKRILQEGYSSDEVWDKMTEEERKTALYVAKSTNPDELIVLPWDSIPADTQDLIDLSNFVLAKDDQGGRSMVRGIEYALKENPNAKKFVDKFLQKIGRDTLRDITMKQSYQLNPGIWEYIASLKPKVVNPNNPNNIQSQPIDPYDRENPSRGYMGAIYRGD
jgi:hypothetical protein